MVLPRVLTAILLVPLVLVVVWAGNLAYFFFVLGICLFGLWEYLLMADEGGYPNQKGMALFGGFLLLLAFYLDGVPWGPLRRSPSVFLVFLLWFFLVFLREFFRKDKGHSFLRIITTVSGVLLCVISLGHLLLIRDLRLVAGEGYQLVGRQMTFFLIVVIWMVDTGAWFVGRLIGRHSLAPQISPKKSWEGAVGGTLIACGSAWFFQSAFLRKELSLREALLFALIIAVAAQISDLIESLLKRSFGVKDSSQLLPGHGGILDRFDSFLFAAPFFYYLLIGTGRFG